MKSGGEEHMRPCQRTLDHVAAAAPYFNSCVVVIDDDDKFRELLRTTFTGRGREPTAVCVD